MKTTQMARLNRQELRRYGHVVAVLTRNGFEDILHRLSAKHDVPWRNKIFKGKIRNIESLSTARRVRLAIEELGPTYVKFGQILSGRSDLLPDDFIDELSSLQDDVPPFPFHEVKTIIEGELGRPLEELYDDFKKAPVAAASLAQVHHAKTKAGEDVAVKVQRPRVGKIIDADIRILRRLAALVERRLPEFACFEPVALVDDFAASIHKELDFVREGRSADDFRRFFKKDGRVHIPKVLWNLTTTKILTMEYIHGIKVSEYARLEAAGLDRKIIALNGANLLLKEIFDVHKFHADPHPGNLFVLENNVIAPVDFGLTGRLDQESVDHLSDLVTAVVDKDVEALATVLLHMCRPAEPIQVGAIQSDLADLLDRYYEAPLQELSMSGIVKDVTAFMRRHKLRFPQEMAMMARSLIVIEGVGCGLYPEFNVLEIMEPYARKLMIRRLDPGRKFREVGKTVDETAILLKTLPSDILAILTKIRRNELAIQIDHRGLERMSSVLDRSSNRLSFAVVIAALIIGSSLVFQTGAGPKVYGYPLPELLGLLIAGVLGLWLLIGILRSGRL
jgi:ubiquinone biosynthesis protein